MAKKEKAASVSEEKDSPAKKKNRFGMIAIIYLIIGLIFAVGFAIYYHWPLFGFFSPGFYAVILTWPFQIFGFIQDFRYYGLQGPPF